MSRVRLWVDLGFEFRLVGCLREEFFSFFVFIIFKFILVDFYI